MKHEIGTTADKLLDPTSSLLEEYLEKAKLEEEKKAIKILAPDLLACEQELDRTRKALDVAMGALKSIQEYGAIAMSELQKNGLGGFQKPVSKMQDMAHLAEKQINEIKGGKDER